MQKNSICLMMLIMVSSVMSKAQPNQAGSDWKMIWNDEFNGNDTLKRNWIFENASPTHILSSRWTKNARLDQGILKLLNRKEQKGGKEFTTASLWTRRTFRYGYFECRYKYGKSTGLNNSFWLMNRPKSNDSTVFEIDINEGHYSNEIATNVHRHFPLPHLADSKLMRSGGEAAPLVKIDLEKEILTNSIRVICSDAVHNTITELKVYPFNVAGYPDIRKTTVNDTTDLIRKANLTVSSSLRDEFNPTYVRDGNLSSRWVSGDDMPSTLTIKFDKPYPVGNIQMISGYLQGREYLKPMNNYAIQYWDGNIWKDIQSTSSSASKVNLAEEFHTYGLEWNEDELIWYFDGKEIRRVKNTYCHSDAHVFLSSAVIRWAGQIGDSIDGTSMDVDYVRIFQKNVR